MRCTEAESLIVPYLEGKLDLNQKMELIRHIRGFREHNYFHFLPRQEASHSGGCRQCRSELEYYYLVYISVGLIEDRATGGEYGKEIEKMLNQTEREWDRAVRKAKVHRFRLIAILVVLGLALSFGVGKSIIEPKPEPISAVKPSFVLGGPALPSGLNFVSRMILDYQDGASDFTASQQARYTARLQIWERDSGITWAMQEGSEFQYALPDEFVESVGSFAEKIVLGRKPAYKPSIRFTLKAQPWPTGKK